jgi:uncharacterized protein
MRIIFLCVLFQILNFSSAAQTIGTFTSVQPSAQSQLFVLPTTHTFQRIIKTGDAITGGTGTLPANNDFTAFVPISGSSTNGYLSINHENTPGAITILDINYNTPTKIWNTTAKNNVNLTAVYTTARNCSGGITPWGTVLSGEESLTAGDGNADNYQDVGWLTEVNPATRTAIRKIWAAGRCAHENAVVKADGSLLYTGADETVQGYLYKYVFTTANDPTNGTLYALQKTGTTGNWLVIANTTIADRNNTGNLAATAGATNFNGIEDVEIGPDGKVYFTSKAFGEVYRFTDNGSSISNFETFVGGSATNYTINYGTGSGSENWGSGNDNLAFDGDGNLWVLQDGGRNHIWMVKPTHTQAVPKVELFGKTPLGSEPTGITFTPDYKFMFISFQHPDGGNTATQTDANNQSVVWNTSTTIVVARKTDLGLSSLPLYNLLLSGKSNTNYNTISWTGLTLDMVLQATIETSTNGIDFFTVVDLDKNYLTTKNTYNHFAIIGQRNYYRLKIWNINGSSFYSNTIGVSNTTKIALSKINAANYAVSLKLNNTAMVSITLYNSLGSQISNRMYKGFAGNNNFSVTIPNVSNELLYLKVSTEEVQQLFKIHSF